MGRVCLWRGRVDSDAHFEPKIAHRGINPFSWKISLEKLGLHCDDELSYGGYRRRPVYQRRFVPLIGGCQSLTTEPRRVGALCWCLNDNCPWLLIVTASIDEVSRFTRYFACPIDRYSTIDLLLLSLWFQTKIEVTMT